METVFKVTFNHLPNIKKFNLTTVDPGIIYILTSVIQKLLLSQVPARGNPVNKVVKFPSFDLTDMTDRLRFIHKVSAFTKGDTLTDTTRGKGS